MEPNSSLDPDRTLHYHYVDNGTLPNSTTASDITIQTALITIILSMVILITAVGNILVCVAVCLVRKLRRPCNYLLVSLAISDLCVAILVMPMAMIYEIKQTWIFGEIACNLWVSFDVLSCTASILNLCMISVDRYNAITKPLDYGVKRTPKRMIIYVFLVWLGAACISLPPLLILGNEHVHEMKGTRIDVCLVCQHIGYQIYATLCSFYIPLAVMILVYYKIFRAARRIVLDEKRAQSHLDAHCYLEISVKNGGGPPENKISSQSPSPANPARINHRTSSASTNTMCSLDKTTLGRCFSTRRSNESQCPMLSTAKPQQTKQASKQKQQKSSLLTSMRTSPGANNNQKKLRFQLAKERKASTTLGIIMSAFTICWLPFFVLALVRPFLSDNSIDALHTLSSVFLWLGYANSLLNPIIYATLNRDFRKPFQEILFFRCGSLNHMMREEFYQSQYGDPDQHVSTRCHVDYEEGVEYIEAGGEETKVAEINTAHESFL